MSESKKSSKSLSMWLLLAAGLLLAFVIFLFLRKKKQQEQEVDPNEEPEIPIDGGYSESLRDVIIDKFLTIKSVLSSRGIDSINLAMILTAQAMHETGLFTSKIFRENKNLFGMRQPRTRETTSKGELNTYASYESYQDSVLDLLMWLSYNSIEPAEMSVKDYVSAIKGKSYFEDKLTTYYSAVNKHFNNLRYELSAN